jgi:GGDEF domain-containing protein
MRPYAAGGEEFLVLLPGFDATVVRSMAETVRGKVADKAFKPGIELRASFGAGVLDAGLSLDKNLTLIDNALYAAKECGRDQVVMVGD